MRKNRWISAVLPPAIVFIGAALIMEVSVRAWKVPPYLLPRPSTVLSSLINDRADLLSALGITAEAALIGFGASTLAGIVAALVLSASPMVRRALYPYTLFFQTVPIIAIAPLLVFWLNAGLQAVAVCAFIVSVFPVIANTLAGLISTDPALVDLFRLYGARPAATLWKLRLPAAIPSLITGLRVSSGLAVIGTVVSEFLVGQLGQNAGLGVKIVSGIKYGHTERVFAAVLLASILGLAMFGTVNLAGYLLLRNWHASER